jgi:outer membrane lipoprotein-sorting protein
MKKLLLSVCALFVSLSAFAQTADEIIDKHIKAMGGADKIKAVQTVKATGKMKAGPMELPITLTKARPEQVRLDFTLQGMTGTQAYDGSTGWMVMPFMGKKDPEKMSDDMLKEIKDEADFDGSLFDYKAKGNTVEYLGKADVQGSPAYKLKVVTKQGMESTLYLDADTYLVIKTEAKRKVQGQEIESETMIGDYKEVDGILYPHSMQSRAKGAPEGQSRSITVEKYEINAKVDSAIFKMPEVKKEEPKAEVKKDK